MQEIGFSVQNKIICVFLLFYCCKDSKLEKLDSLPLKVVTPISGSFAEYRPTHLHLGIDLKTFLSNQWPIYSMDNVYISEISQKNRGYGLNIITSSTEKDLKYRFAHLTNLNSKYPKLESLREVFSLLNNGEFQVKLPTKEFQFLQSEKIAETGETGSGISHLHLEIFSSLKYYNPIQFLESQEEDKTSPTIVSLFLDQENGNNLIIPIAINENSINRNTIILEQPILVQSNVNVKIGAYDIFSSFNRNNLYDIQMYLNNQLIYQRKFNELHLSDALKNYTLYDVNRSSLDPPVYIYNLFEPSQNSINFASFLGEKPNQILIRLLDYFENKIDLKFTLMKDHSNSKVNFKKKLRFLSTDNKIEVNFKNDQIFGQGNLQINPINAIPKEAQIKGLELLQHVPTYLIETKGLIWSGFAEYQWKNITLKSNEGVFLYHLERKNWENISIVKKSNTIHFKLDKTGMIAIFKDLSKPKISLPFLVTRYRSIQKNSNFYEFMYKIDEIGLGFSPNQIEVSFNDQKYPFNYDFDRKSVYIEIPKSFLRKEKVFNIQLKVKDYANNSSDILKDIIKL